MTTKTKVVVAMSGGVDSSVAAALLSDQGYEVVGMMLRLWSEPGAEEYNHCCTPEAMALARRVAARLDIPFYVLDVRERFHQTVVRNFLDGYAAGVTPNPCLVCNREIRWGWLLSEALNLGAESMATGHYARLRRLANGRTQLLRAFDRAKDQSYVLSVLDQDQLSRAMFPLGDLTKPQVRDLARYYQLPVSNRSDSQDLCFLAGQDYRDFLRRNAPESLTPGVIRDLSGRVLGRHEGLGLYTIGQRRGLGLSAPTPLYVVDKDAQSNELFIGTQADLGRSRFVVKDVHWIMGPAPDRPLQAQVKIRYRAPEVAGTITPQESGQVRVDLETPLRDITPGQAAVFYRDETCLGGGIITQSLSGG